MTTIEFAIALFAVIVALAGGYWLGLQDGKAIGRQICPAVTGQEIVATTPTACMYSDRGGRAVYRRGI